MRTPLPLLASILALCILLSACGQKGPLYLPQDPAAPATSPATGTHSHGQPANVRKKEETDKTKDPSQTPSEPNTEAEAVTK